MNMPFFEKSSSPPITGKLTALFLGGGREFPVVVDRPFVYKKLDDGYNVVFYNTVFGFNRTTKYVASDEYLNLGIGLTSNSRINLQYVSKAHVGYAEMIEGFESLGLTAVDLIKFIYCLFDTDKLTAQEREECRISNITGSTVVVNKNWPRL